jgi:hypothetical protein
MLALGIICFRISIQKKQYNNKYPCCFHNFPPTSFAFTMKLLKQEVKIAIENIRAGAFFSELDLSRG